MKRVEASELPGGFVWGAVKAGIKASGNLDLAAAVPAPGAVGAAMFTTNRVVAAPVTVGRRHLLATGGRVGAVLVNAGNANCATGLDGLEGCLATCVAAAQTFGCIFDEVVPSSTGIIGVPFPAEKVVAAMPALKASLGSSAEHAELFAKAILTTDTRMKVASAVVGVGDAEIRIWGAAKGAGMIHPKLGETVPAAPHATMLVYLFTDAMATAAELAEALGPAAEGSFNSISIDGDTSTNDTVLLVASGASGVRVGEAAGEFAAALAEVCGSLAYQIVDDGEGVGHVVTLEVRAAATAADAKQVARAIALSPLNKTAWSSADPNWGRLMAAAGYSGVEFDPAKVRVWIGDVPVFELGERAAGFDEAAAHRAMTERHYTITLDLGMGEAACRFVTCDLTAEYVRINADYST